MSGIEIQKKIKNLRAIDQEFIDQQYKSEGMLTPQEAWEKRKNFFTFGSRNNEPDRDANEQYFDYTHNPFYNKSLGFFDYRPQLKGHSDLQKQLLEGAFQKKLVQIEEDIRSKISQFERKTNQLEAEKEQRIINFIVVDRWEQDRPKSVNLRISGDLARELKLPLDRLEKR